MSVEAAGVPPLRASGRRRVGAELDLAAEHRIRAAIVHHQQDEVGGLRAELESDAGAFECEHRRRAPRTVEGGSRAARNHAAAVAAADAERQLSSPRETR